MKNISNLIKTHYDKILFFLLILVTFNTCSVNKTNRLLVENRTYYDDFIVDEMIRTDSIALDRMKRAIANRSSIFIKDIKRENLNTLYLFLMYEQELDRNRIDLSTIKSTLDSYKTFIDAKDVDDYNISDGKK